MGTRGFISNISLFTFCFLCPWDACIAVCRSKAVDSDSVRDKFLLPEQQSLIPPSKKELYFPLCDNLVYIEDGGKSVCLDKESGKICVMLSPKQFYITFDSPYFWEWISIPESRFDKVPELIVGIPFKIYGAMNTQILSPQTHYSAYIVYKTKDKFHGVKYVGVGFLGQGTHEAKEWKRKKLMKVDEREDGWMETEIGRFFNRGEEGLLGCDEISFSIIEMDYSYWIPGLIIQGIDIRPTREP